MLCLFRMAPLPTFVLFGDSACVFFLFLDFFAPFPPIVGGILIPSVLRAIPPNRCDHRFPWGVGCSRRSRLVVGAWYLDGAVKHQRAGIAGCVRKNGVAIIGQPPRGGMVTFGAKRNLVTRAAMLRREV